MRAPAAGFADEIIGRRQSAERLRAVDHWQSEISHAIWRDFPPNAGM